MGSFAPDTKLAVAVAGGGGEDADQDLANAGEEIVGKGTESAPFIAENGDCPPATADSGSDEPDSEGNGHPSAAPVEDPEMADPDSEENTCNVIQIQDNANHEQNHEAKVMVTKDDSCRKENFAGENMPFATDNGVVHPEEKGGDESPVEEPHLESQQEVVLENGYDCCKEEDGCVEEKENLVGDDVDMHTFNGVVYPEEKGGEGSHVGEAAQISVMDNGVVYPEEKGGDESHIGEAAQISVTDSSIEAEDIESQQEVAQPVVPLFQNGNADLEGNDDGIEVVKACSDEDVRVERDGHAKDTEIGYVSDAKFSESSDENDIVVSDENDIVGSNVEEKHDQEIATSKIDLDSPVDQEGDEPPMGGQESPSIPAETVAASEDSPSTEKVESEECNQDSSLDESVGTSSSISLENVENLQSEVCSSCSVQAVEDENTGEEHGETNTCEEATRTTIDSTNSDPELEEKSDASGTRPQDSRVFLFMAVVPRVTDEALEGELQHIKDQKDENVMIRNSFTVELREQRSMLRGLKDELTAAKEEERIARNAFTAKHKELDDLQMENEIDEVAEQIRSMENSLQHESMPLKQEKQLINDIKKLKQRHSSLRATLGPKLEGEKALEPKDQGEEGFKLLRKEIQNLRNQLSSAEHKTKDARREHDAAYQCVVDLQKRRDEAHDLQQQQYEQMKEIQKILQEKNKYFYDFKDDYSAAIKYKFAGDKEGLQNHCTRQVEKFMELWNNNKDYREQYIKCQETKAMRRSGASARSNLGPNAEPPVIPRSEEKQSSVVVPSSSINDPLLPSENSADGSDHSTSKENDPHSKVVQTSQSLTSKKPPKPASKKSRKPTTAISSSTISSAEEIEEPEADNHYRISKEEEELARKEDEMRKEKAAAELKEKLRLEEIAKAKEAEERKRRNTEKAKARAEYKALKETEENEKKKAKKEKKKERKKKKLMSGQTSGDGDGVDEIQDAAAITEVDGGDEKQDAATEVNPPEITHGTKASVTTSKRKGKLKSSIKKPTTTQPLPLLLRKKARRKQMWIMWVLLVVAVVLALFAAGNYISASTFANLRNKF